ncbi:MAG: hypothetical protein M1820_002438 [Bogoriella megaspora]|nr:MAG: hypothetical protein M1820_002438 [Bogoriella megaspora]
MFTPLALISILSWATSVISAPQAAPTSSSKACNNSPQLCNRNYNNITHLGAHDSAFVRDSSTGFSTSGNQFYNSTVQLSAGVRLLTGQIHSVTNSSGSDEWHLCHTSCALLDAGTLSDWLAGIKTWMDSNPNEVVTVLIVNDGASNRDLDANFRAANIVNYAYVPQTTGVPQQWPTLDTLISSNKRLMTFVASLETAADSSAPYLMNEFEFIFENPFDVTAASNFSCTADRPSSVKGQTSKAIQSNMMPLMNHFLDQEEAFGIEIPNVDRISITNGAANGTGNLGDTAAQCAATYGKAPTFVLVDFFNVGPAIKTIDKLNGVVSPAGRAPVSSSTIEAFVSSATNRGSGLGGSLVGLWTLTVFVAAFVARL